MARSGGGRHRDDMAPATLHDDVGSRAAPQDGPLQRARGGTRDDAARRAAPPASSGRRSATGAAGPALAPARPGSIDALDRRRRRELATLKAMFAIYCREHHHRGIDACEECSPLLAYATRRLVRCVFGAAKPTCANCTVHCYSETMRDRIKAIMRHAGPRMLHRHPILAIAHLLDGRKTPPTIREQGTGNS